jgi:hypothetical protein|tara:strand:+ start:68 stop:394 length:327 start_codon:yes stop_codon:yes gene_type:complete
MADVLKVQKTNVVDADGEIVLLGVSADSQTVLSISICETGNADETFSLLHTAAGGGTEFYIYIDQSLPAKSTFIHSDKIVVDDTDQLWVKSGGAANLDVIVTFLAQDD